MFTFAGQPQQQQQQATIQPTQSQSNPGNGNNSNEGKMMSIILFLNIINNINCRIGPYEMIDEKIDE